MAIGHRLLPLLILLFLAAPVLASGQTPVEPASPASEPDTWMLLGSGAVLLLLLYTRRRSRARSINLRAARSRLKAAS